MICVSENIPLSFEKDLFPVSKYRCIAYSTLVIFFSGTDLSNLQKFASVTCQQFLIEIVIRCKPFRTLLNFLWHYFIAYWSQQTINLKDLSLHNWHPKFSQLLLGKDHFTKANTSRAPVFYIFNHWQCRGAKMCIMIGFGLRAKTSGLKSNLFEV